MKEVVEKIKKMTAAEIIMAMVEGLRNPVTEIDMDTYGEVRKNGKMKCYGCAATNTIAKIAGLDNKWLVKNLVNREKTTRGVTGFSRINYNVETTVADFIDDFEYAINVLRKGNVDGYNYWVGTIGVATIKDLPDEYLPRLDDNYTSEDLDKYEELAAEQP